MKNKRLLLFLVPFILFHLSANFAHPVTPAFIVERRLDSSMFGVALAAMMTMNFLFSPFWGGLCSAIPTRRIQLITCLGYALGQVFFLFSHSETAVILARLFAGAFTGGAFTAFTNYVIHISPDPAQRDSSLTIMVTVQSVASACGYFIGGMLGVVSTELSFVVQILCLALSGILFAVLCVDDTALKPQRTTPLTPKDFNPFLSFTRAGAFLTPTLVIIFAVVAISSIGQNSYEQAFNYFIKDQYGMSSAYNGTFKAIIALLTLLLNSTVCMWLQRKTDVNRTFLYILLLCSGLIGVILVFRSQLLFVAIYILYSAVNVMRLPMLQSMVAQRADAETRSSMMGFYQSMTSLGGIFGALFAGLIYKQGAMLPFVLAFAAYTLAFFLGVGISKKRK